MSVVHVFLAILLSAAGTPASGAPPSPQQHDHQHDAGRPPEQLGRVQFETSCDAAVAADFNRGVALLHSFWFSAAAEQFTRVAERDPSCAMAWWGVAMSRWGNPFAPSRPVRALEEGRVAIEKAAAVPARTDRERQYIAAARELFTNYESMPHRTRIENYERAMQQLYESHRQDREAAAFYALAVNQTARPDDKSYAQQLKAAALLEPLFEEQPDHPGAAHYLIHAYDHPPLAERALPAARRYAKVAPDAPHALHMPSHTFTRVGLWEDSIATNRASADAARRAKSPGEVLHALDYQMYAYLQIAQDRAARQALDELQAITSTLNNNEQYGLVGLFASAAMPARYALERGAWSEAASLEPRTTPFPFIDAMTHFARAVGAARSGNADAARAEAAKLAELHAALGKSGDEYWAQQVEIQHVSALGWTAFAAGQHEEAVRLLRRAAEIEGSTDKAAITPGPLAPARELLGEMLLELERPGEALAELEAVMKTEPNRFRTLYGAARAAKAAGAPAKASQYYAQLVEMCRAADSPARPELERARRSGDR
jgi:tetratricopeptide (TPR) repeat protein